MVLVVLVVLLLSLGLLLWFLPARWVQASLEARLHGLRLDEVSGTVWDGRAGRLLTADGHDLGKLAWQVPHAALWGDMRLSVGLDGPQLSFHGDMHQRDAQRVEWHALHLQGDIDALGNHAVVLGGMLHGQVSIDIAHVLLQGRWPLELDGKARWSEAEVTTARGVLALGEIQLQAQGQEGVIQGQLRDGGSGPLQLDGQLGLSPLGWRYDVNARPRGINPALQAWLQGLGRADADGTVHIKGSGGLVKTAGGKGKP
jgi:general secretion pathway protein N